MRKTIKKGCCGDSWTACGESISTEQQSSRSLPQRAQISNRATNMSRKKWIQFPRSSIVFHARQNKVYIGKFLALCTKELITYKIRPFDLSPEKYTWSAKKKLFTSSCMDIGSQLNCCLLSTLLNKGGQPLTRH